MTPRKPCCEKLRLQLNWTCTDHAEASDCPDALIGLFGAGRYGLYIHDGGSSLLEIHFCPWCGTRLSSLDSATPAGARATGEKDLELMKLVD